MDELSILINFAVGLAGALVFGYIALRLKLSPIIGYLVVGIVVGPFTPGVFVNRAIAEQFAEFGVILLLFGIGLRFHLRELIAVWRVAIPGALIQSTLSTTRRRPCRGGNSGRPDDLRRRGRPSGSCSAQSVRNTDQLI